MRRYVFALLLLGVAMPAAADVITSADLQISGADFRLVTTTATVQLGTPAIIQTSLGGLKNDQAPTFTNGTFATGELIGPGITTPVPFIAAPGRAFTVSGFSQEGTYYLQNVRMMNGARLLQVATPSLATIQVTNALNATVTVRQLSADDLRKRGISLDPSNYDVYEYTFSFLVNGQTVEIPYPVVINRITHEVTPLPHESPYKLPTDTAKAPPRWNPPATIPVEFPEPAAFSRPLQTEDNPDALPPPRPQIHAAIVIPNSLAVLHEFFGVALVVTNAAPSGSGVTLDSIAATIDAPNQLRLAKSDPPVTFGQPVTITGPNGVTLLAAQVQGKSEWTFEGLKAGTYTLNLDVKATFHSPGQPDLPLEAKPSAAIVVHDARFNIAFSHPDTIRKGLQYSTHTFITNVSEAAQDITLSDGGLPSCGGSGGTSANVCRIATSPSSFSLHLEPGETKSVEYKLQSSLTGYVFANAVSIDGTDSAINSAAFTLDMGVSPTGVPLSPVTLILPHYATTPYLSQSFLDDQLGFLGIAYSLATAPMNKTTSKFPRLIKSDVFTRAVDIARAGERIFIGEDRRDSLANLALDLLGNDVPLAEWDQFRRQEIADPAGDTARAAMTALASEVAGAYGTGGTFNGMADRFAAATSDRVPYLFVLARGPKNGTAPSFAVSVAAGALVLDGAKRDIPYGEVDPLDATGESGTMAIIGRSSGAVDLTVTAAVSGPAVLDLVIPSADGTTLVRATAPFTATTGQAIHVHVAGGVATSSESGVVFSTAAVPLAPIQIVAARQDLFLDGDGHVVSVLFNRRLQPTTADLSADFATDVALDPAKYDIAYSGQRVVAGAALQSDGRIVRLNYDNALSNDAQYTIHHATGNVVPKIEDRSSALLFGSVLKGDNTPVAGAQVTLSTVSGVQRQTADASGRFLFEYVPRDPDNGIGGGYGIEAHDANQTASVTGSVRLLHTVHRVNIVFLGRGAAKGTVRYDDGTPVAGATVVIGSTLVSQFRTGGANQSGLYNITDLPVGPLTFSARDAAGNVAYAANELRAAGELVLQDITIFRKQFPGTGTVRGRIIRNDNNEPVPNTHVGVYSQGYGLQDGFTDAAGRFEFARVPSGFVTVLAENYAVAPRSIAVDFDLKPDEVRKLPDLVLAVPAAATLVAVRGTVSVEDPYIAGRFTPVSSAQVQIDGMPVVTADADGAYRYDAVPTSFAGARIRGFDPRSGRVGMASLTLSAETNEVPIVITNVGGSGTGTVRVHLLDARGQPVTGYHVFEPGIPRLESAATGEGVYEFKDLAVGSGITVVAAPAGTRDPTYGYQWVQGHAGVSFPGQIAALTLHLPGQSDVHAVIKQQTEAGVLVQVAGQLHLTHRVWSDSEQNAKQLVRLATTDSSHDAVFDQVPAGEGITLETFESVGYDATSFIIGFDGAPVSKVLTLSTLASVRGHVFMPDGYTPVAGAQVNLLDGAQDMGWLPTALDGSFEFRNVSPHSGFTVKAEFTQNGIYRTGYVTGNTPQNGGPVENVSVILMKQGAVEGSVVDANNSPIPFAKIWMRELSFPNRPFGTQQEPLLTDANGHFRFNNIFTVPFRITAEDPINPDLRGSFNGVVGDENVVVQASVVVGGAGTGAVQITVKDKNTLQPVPNAEVSLFHGSLFDFATTDLNGTVTFEQVPVATSYTASAYSKSLAKIGATDAPFAVTRDGTVAVTVNLEFSGEVKGTLDDPQNQKPGLPGVDVTLSGAGYQTRATTDLTGAFDFNGVREGNVDLVARDPASIRLARNKGTLSAANGTVIVPLHLEPTSTLVVKVFLPSDSGASSGVLVPNVTIDVAQSAPGGFYHRTSQTNGDSFLGLVRNIGFVVNVQEIGGLNRTYRVNDSFNDTTDSKEIDITLAATGSVVVHVQQGSPAVDAPNVQVTAASGGAATSAFTDAAGKATLTHLPLGTVSIQARTLGSQPLTGATSVALNSQTQAANATILLGSYGGVTGKVIAEAGGASAGTRVFAAFSGVNLETRTDAMGGYVFQGIATPPSGTPIALTYIGPDDNTVGAAQTVVLHNGDGILAVPDVTLDSTPPRLVAIFPAGGATKVAPDTQLKFTFSRAIRDDQLNNGYFKLFDVGAAQQLTLTLVSKQFLPDKSEIVTFNPPATPAGQHFPLKSNTLYRTEVSSDLQDLANHKLAATLSASFTTSDYSNPQVIKVEPKSPLPKSNFRIAVTFSKPLGTAAWSAGGSGVMQLTPISALGGSVVGSPLPGQVQLDPGTGATLYFAPDVFLAEAAYYRLTISGVTDTDGRALVDSSGNLLSTFTQDFFSYDTTAPGITIANPTVNGNAIGDNDPLYVTTLYRFPVTLTNAADLDRVDFVSIDGAGVETPISRATPTSVSLSLPQGTTTFKLKATAYDLSGNKASATRTWTVSQQPALSVVSATITPAIVYANNKLTDTVVIGGGGLDATVKVTARLEGSSSTLVSAQTTITRATFDSAWPSAAVQLTIPATTPGGAHLVLTEEISDVRGGAASHVTSVTLATDTNAPQMQALTIEVVSGTSNSTFHNGDKFRVHAFAKDDETGVKQVAFTVDGVSSTLTSGTLRSTGYTEYVSSTFTVKARNNDLAMPVSAIASDYAAGTTTTTTAVTYLGQHDPNAPAAAWIAPLNGAAWPAGVPFQARLRVYAASSLPLTAKFDVPSMTPGQIGQPNGSNELYLDVNFAQTPPAGTPFQIVAHVDDGDGNHTIDLPIDIDLVDVGLTLHAGDILAVDAQHPLAVDSVLVDHGHLVPHVPVTLKNLIVINGGLVDTVPSTTTLDQKLDLAVSGHLYVDDSSSINVSSRGYLGGLQSNFDNTGSNGDARGMTLGRSVGAGAANGASASYAGIGGSDNGTTNPTYGSIAAPADLGSGGAADSSNRPGGQGGGALSVSGAAKVVIAGGVLADGQSGQNIGGAGSGGSIHIAGARVVVGALGTVSVSGGDDDASATLARGGGGGRISLEAAELLDLDANNGARVIAHGGRNLTSEGASILEGGAGTIFLRSPASTDGDLVVSDSDPRYPLTTHAALSTVLGGALTFDHVTVGPRGLARADAPLTIGGVVDDRSKASVDATGVLVLAGDLPAITASTTPVAGSSVIAGTNINLTYTATSIAGVYHVTSTLSPALAPITDSYAFPLSITTTPAKALNVPFNAAARTATLSVRVLDRAGRTADAAASTFTIVANAPPAIDRFDVTPAGLQMYAGGTIAVDAAATDDVAITSLALTATNGTVSSGAPVVNGHTTSRTFSVATAKTLAGGSSVALTLKADDVDPTHTATQQKSVAILHDTSPPVVTITGPGAGETFEVSSLVTIPIRATVTDAEVGVASVWATVGGGAPIAMTPDPSTPNGWKVDAAVPPVDGTDPVPTQIVVSAKDYEPNTGNSAPRQINIKPAFDPLAPIVTWLCPTSGAMFLPGYVTTLSVKAVPAKPENDVDSVTFYVGDSPAPHVATKVAGTTTWTATNIQLAAGVNGDAVVLRAVAHAVGDVSAEVRQTVTLVTGDEISQTQTLAAGDTTRDNHTVIVTGGTLTIDGAHTFARFVVLDGATVVHAAGGMLNLTVTGATYISCGGAIDVSTRGFAAGAGYPGATLPAGSGSAGSHLGVGVAWVNGTAGSTFGSVDQPQEAGGGAFNGNGAGGGVVHLSTTALTLNGAIRANGEADGSGASASGAGGAVWIQTGTLDGNGAIEVRGGDNVNGLGGGGGGAIAIESTGATGGSVLANLLARGGNGSNNNDGGAGTIYLKGAGATFGDLTVDNKTLATGKTTDLPALGNGFALQGSSGRTLVTDRATNIPAYFANHWVEVRDAAGLLKGTWRIDLDPNNPKTVTLKPNAAETITVQQGDQWRGIYRFDHLTANKVTISTADRLDVTNAPQLLNGAVILGNNQGPPVVDKTKISFVVHPLGPEMVAAAGAVTDSDAPITVFVVNQTAGTTTTGITAAANGSFSVSLKGAAGDSIAVYAKDSNFFPMQSQPVVIGTLPVGSVQTTSLPITSAMTTDTNFRARRLAADGTILVAQNYPASPDSNKLLVFDLSSGAPVWTQTLTLSNTRDVIVRNSVAYVAASGSTLYAADLSTNPATLRSVNPGCTDSSSIAVDGGYAYLGLAGNCTDGRIAIFDVTDPKVPVQLVPNTGQPATQSTLPSASGNSYTQLIPYGNYLIGITAQGTHDVVVLDRRDVNALTKLSEIDIANFTAFRASLQGSTLSVNGLQGSVAVVDLSPLPAAAVVKSVTALASSGHGIQAVNNFVAAADDTAGIQTLDATNPSAPQTSGTIITSPQAAWDVAIRGQLGIIAAEDRLLTFAIAVAPQVNLLRVTVTRGATTATVAGTAGAISGAAPMTLVLRNDTSGASAAGVAVAANGSFSSSITANAGDAISITVTDANAAPSNAVKLGVVPFAPVVSVPVRASSGDNNFRSRRIAIDGNTLITSNNNYFQDTNKTLVYDLSGGTPAFVQTLTAVGNTRDVVVRNGVAYVVSPATLNAFDLSVTPATRVAVGAGCTNAYSLAVDGNRAYMGLGTSCTDGRIAVYDLTNPKSPVLLSSGISTVSGVGAVVYTQLIPYGTNQLVGVCDNATNTVVIIDRTNPTSLTKVAAVGLPTRPLSRARIVGHMLYGVTNGTSAKGLVIVDLSNLTATPVFVQTPGTALGIEVDPATLRVYVTDGGSGVTVIDASVPSTAHVIATQPLNGNGWEAAFASPRLFVAGDIVFNLLDFTATGGSSTLTPVVQSAPASPTLRADRALIGAEARDGRVVVRGARGALAGPRPISIEIRNLTLGTSLPVVPVAADGSFEVVLDAAAGDHIILIATSGDGERLEIDLGTIGARTSGPQSADLRSDDSPNVDGLRTRPTSVAGRGRPATADRRSALQGLHE